MHFILVPLHNQQAAASCLTVSESWLSRLLLTCVFDLVLSKASVSRCSGGGDAQLAQFVGCRGFCVKKKWNKIKILKCKIVHLQFWLMLCPHIMLKVSSVSSHPTTEKFDLSFHRWLIQWINPLLSMKCHNQIQCSPKHFAQSERNQLIRWDRDF